MRVRWLFFDNLYNATGQYKDAADNIYSWLMNKMYDKTNGIFFKRGELYTKSGMGPGRHAIFFSPDTTSWAPVERMLNDPNFGVTIEDRLNKIGLMGRVTELLTGVKDVNGKLIGMSFSQPARANNIISIEWSSQFSLFYWRVAQEYSKLTNSERNPAKERQQLAIGKMYINKYSNLTAVENNIFLENCRNCHKVIFFWPPKRYSQMVFSSR